MKKENLTLLTDLYELTMMNGYFDMRRDERVVFDVFYRKNPCDGGYRPGGGLSAGAGAGLSVCHYLLF